MLFEIAVLLIAVVGLVTWVYDKRHPHLDERFLEFIPPPRKYPLPKMHHKKDISNERWWG